MLQRQKSLNPQKPNKKEMHNCNWGQGHKTKGQSRQFFRKSFGCLSYLMENPAKGVLHL